MKRFNTRGFTIIEIMIATLIFTVVLLVIMYGITATTKDYFKGVNSSTAQTTARTIVNAVAQSIQFSTGSVSSISAGGHVVTYCVGNTKQFDFVMYKEVGTGGVGDALWETPMVTAGCAQVPDSGPGSSSKSESLIGTNMRLQKFSITPVTPTTYNIDVEVIYGADDLLCDADSGASPGCPHIANAAELAGGAATLQCAPNSGSQFCYTAELNTTAGTRGTP